MMINKWYLVWDRLSILEDLRDSSLSVIFVVNLLSEFGLEIWFFLGLVFIWEMGLEFFGLFNF